MTAVHQFLATFAPRDAVGVHALHARRILRGLGVASEVYADGIVDGRGTGVRPFREYEPDVRGRPTHLLYQLSTGSVVAEFLRSRPEPLVLNHHNVTPSRFAAPWEPHLAVELEVGERQLRRLAPVAELGVGVSSFNRAALAAAGCARTVVAPVLADLDADRAEPDSRLLDELRLTNRGTDWLFVGRVTPHKAQHHVVAAFAAYRRLYDTHARLWLVGAVGSAPYAAALRAVIAQLGLAEAVRLTGSVSAERLAAYYRAAGVFVCLSEHEGFCVPLLEAMAAGLPVVAFAAGAVAETVGDAGLVLRAKDPVTVAAAVHRAHDDEPTRRALTAAGHRRVADFGLARAAGAFEAAMATLLD